MPAFLAELFQADSQKEESPPCYDLASFVHHFLALYILLILTVFVLSLRIIGIVSFFFNFLVSRAAPWTSAQFDPLVKACMPHFAAGMQCLLQMC